MKKMMTLLFLLCSTFVGNLMTTQAEQSSNFITIAILAKDKAHVLPLYLACIEAQTWPKKQTNLYIRTNNNNDNTVQILKNWLASVQDLYAQIYFDDTDIEAPVHLYGQHEWNSVRFKALGKIRQESIDWALQKDSDYFVADCDNFIQPNTVEAMMQAKLPIVAPFLKTSCFYSNYHADVDEQGYLKSNQLYYDIFFQSIKDCVQVPVVHCTYFIRKEFLADMSYDDNSYRYEYVIFSDNARKKNISQHLDNREIYGYITFATDSKSFLEETWLQEQWLQNLMSECLH